MSVKFLMESYSLVFPVCGEDGTLAAMPLCPSAASPACGKNHSSWTVNSNSSDIPLCTGETAAAPGGAALRKRYPSACGKNPSMDVVRFPVTKVPVSMTIVPYNRVLRGLRGRIGSGLPSPYRC